MSLNAQQPASRATPGEWGMTWQQVLGLWPDWKPTMHQGQAWEKSLRHRPQAAVRNALDKVAETSINTPSLPDVISNLPKHQETAHYAMRDKIEQWKREMEADPCTPEQKKAMAEACGFTVTQSKEAPCAHSRTESKRPDPRG